MTNSHVKPVDIHSLKDYKVPVNFIARKFLAAALAIFIIAPAVFFYMDFRGWVKDADESAWLFSTPYFRHFMCGDAAHPDWKDMDALDHPPLAKYFYGAALAIHGVKIGDLSYKGTSYG